MTPNFTKRKKDLDIWISDPFNVTSLHDSKVGRLFSQISSREPSIGIISSDLRFLAEFKIASGISKLWDGNYSGLSELKTGISYLYFSDKLYVGLCVERNNAVDVERLSITLAFSLYIDDCKISDEVALYLFEAYEASEDGAFSMFEKFIINTYLLSKGKRGKFSNLEFPYNLDLSIDEEEILTNISESLCERDKYLKNEDHLAFDFPGIDVFPIEFGALISVAKKMRIVDIHSNLKSIPDSFWKKSYDNIDFASDGGIFELIKVYACD